MKIIKSFKKKKEKKNRLLFFSSGIQFRIFAFDTRFRLIEVTQNKTFRKKKSTEPKIKFVEKLPVT